jgi:flagellin
MGLRIQNNIEAMNAHKNLTISTNMMAKSLERLSSGYRINKASDDATGLGISTSMRVEISSLKQAARNVAQANADIQVAEGAYDQIANILSRLGELATQQGTTAGTEAATLVQEINRIGASVTGGGTIQVGADATSNSQITVSMSAVTASGLGIGSLNASLGSADLTAIRAAATTLSGSRASLGAAQNRLGYASANLATTIENKTAAESVIRDVDMAAEMSSFTKSQILVQAGTAMLAQANMSSQGVLSLFG